MNGSGTNKTKGFYSIRGRHGPSEDMGLSRRRHRTSETAKTTVQTIQAMSADQDEKSMRSQRQMGRGYQQATLMRKMNDGTAAPHPQQTPVFT